MSTYSPDLIFPIRLAGMGGSAGERIIGDLLGVAADLGDAKGPNREAMYDGL